MPRVMHKHNLYLWQPCYRAFVYHLTNVKAAYDFRCYVAHISSTHFFSICVTFSPMVAPTHTMLRFDIFNSKPGCKLHKIPVCTKWKNTFIPIPYWINVNVLLNSFCYSFFFVCFVHCVSSGILNWFFGLYGNGHGHTYECTLCELMCKLCVWHDTMLCVAFSCK